MGRTLVRKERKDRMLDISRPNPSCFYTIAERDAYM